MDQRSTSSSDRADMRRRQRDLDAPRDELATGEARLESSAQIRTGACARKLQLNTQGDALRSSSPILSSASFQRVLLRSIFALTSVRSGRLSPLEEVRKLLGQVDVPVRQVLIEARIVEARHVCEESSRAVPWPHYAYRPDRAVQFWDDRLATLRQRTQTILATCRWLRRSRLDKHLPHRT